MPSTKNFTNEQKGLFGLFLGPPDSAKSGAALSFPNSMTMDFDRKMPDIGIKHFPNKEMSWQCFEDIFQTQAFMQEMYKNCPYETLIIDTITSLSSSIIATIDKSKGTNVYDRLKNVSVGKKGDKTIEVMGYDYYNGEANFFEYFMDALKILHAKEGNPKHVIVLAHEIIKTQTDLAGNVKITKQIVTHGAKAAAFIPSRFDNSFYFEKVIPNAFQKDAKVQRICHTSGAELARTSYNFPQKIDFTDKSLYDELNKVAHWS